MTDDLSSLVARVRELGSATIDENSSEFHAIVALLAMNTTNDLDLRKALAAAMTENVALHRNLTATQTRCTELIQESRELRRRLSGPPLAPIRHCLFAEDGCLVNAGASCRCACGACSRDRKAEGA